jgi:hypothetical protein
VEANEFVEKLDEFDYQLDLLGFGAMFDAGELVGFYREYGLLLRSTLEKSRRVYEQFVTYFNTTQVTTHALIGRMRRIRQKRAALENWGDYGAKYVLADHFYNLDFLDWRFSPGKSLSTDLGQGVLTLPAEGYEPVRVARSQIAQGSNGRPGNSNEAVNGSRTAFAFDNDPNDWFEYERLDAGPLRLSLQVEFDKPEVCNQLTISPIHFENASAFVLEDIVFTLANGSTQTLTELAGTSLDLTKLQIKSVGTDVGWKLHFLPVKARIAVLKFRQDSFYPIQLANGTVRNRWAIGLKQIEFGRVRYGQAGSVNSVGYQLPGGLYAGLPFVDVWPADPKLYDLMLDYSLDGGATWSRPVNADTGIGETILLDGAPTTFIWRLNVTRNDEALQNASSFNTSDTDVSGDVKSILKVVSPAISPATIQLSERPKNQLVHIQQPRIARRGSRLRKLVLGRTKGVAARIPLPVDLFKASLDITGITVTVEGVPYTYVDDFTAVSAGEWSLTEDMKELVLSSDTEAGAEVGIVFEEELMFFTAASNGFYHEVQLPFDADKENIKIEYVRQESARAVFRVPGDKRVIQLPHKNLIAESCTLVVDGVPWVVHTDSRTSAASTGNCFVDVVAGVLVLPAALGAVGARLSYDHRTRVLVNDADYQIVYRRAVPVGVLLSPTAFTAATWSDTVGETLHKRYNLQTNVYEARNDVFVGVSRRQMLSCERIVRGTLTVGAGFLGPSVRPVEVDFIDGASEFLGLVQVADEFTNETAETSPNVVVFNLAAGSLYDSTFAPSFSNDVVFGTHVANAGLVNGTGKYHVSASGVVTVYVGPGGVLPGGIAIGYFYRNPEFVPANKYSVDYLNGVVYSYVPMEPGTVITYKTASYIMSYDVCAPVPFSYRKESNSVQVSTQNLLGGGSKSVKIYWEVDTGTSKMKELAPFFSPLIESFGVRFR